MSLNRYEQALFDYWKTQPDECRHWRFKVADATAARGQPGETVRGLERELWDYLAERSEHVKILKDLHAGGIRRVSLLNLAEHIVRLWGPPPKPKTKPSG